MNTITATNGFTPRQFTIIFWFSFFAGTILRLFVAQLGHNYDLASWFYVGEAILKGENPYTTFRFNYAPTSAYLLGLIRWIQDFFWSTPEPYFNGELLNKATALPFHFAIVTFLSVADGMIAFLLRRFSFTAALVYLLHPATDSPGGARPCQDHFRQEPQAKCVALPTVAYALWTFRRCRRR